MRVTGRKRFIGRVRVLRWVLSVFAIWTPSMLIFGPRTHQLSTSEIIRPYRALKFGREVRVPAMQAGLT
jgi:hypothetical protein